MQEAVRSAYHDRFDKPITTSPRLWWSPESVPNRTLANIPIPLVPLLPRLPTTGQPVEAPRNATTVPGATSCVVRKMTSWRCLASPWRSP